MRYFYRCGVCHEGFWYDKEIEDNNIDCLNCGSWGGEEIYDEGIGKVVPKLHRIQIGTNERGEIELPSYSFECTSCGHKFGVFKGMKDVEKTACPSCKAKYDDLVQIYGVPQVISDMDNREGRINESMDMSHVFGEGARVSTVKQLREYQRIARDKYMVSTGTDKRILKPFRNPQSGKVEMEYVTIKGHEVDLGEIHEADPDDTKKNKAEREEHTEKDWVKAEHKAAAEISD